MKDKILLFLMYISLCHCDSASSNNSDKKCLTEKDILNVLVEFRSAEVRHNKTQPFSNDSIDYIDKQNMKLLKLANDSYSILQSTSKKITEIDTKFVTLYTRLHNFTRCCEAPLNSTSQLRSTINIGAKAYNEFYTNRLIRINIFSLIFLIVQFIIIIMLISVTVCTYRNNFNLLKK